MTTCPDAQALVPSDVGTKLALQVENARLKKELAEMKRQKQQILSLLSGDGGRVTPPLAGP